MREEEAAELIRERQEAARRKLEQDAKRRADEAEARDLREKQIVLAREVGNSCKHMTALSAGFDIKCENEVYS